MPSQIFSNPFVIHPTDDLVQNNLDLKNMSLRLADKYAGGHVVTDDDLKIMGSTLWNVLGMQSDFDAAYNGTRDAILPIIIESDAPDMQALPWETLFHPTYDFIGRNPAFTLTRQFSAGNETARPLDKGPLRVLLFTSLPDDLNPETGRLNVEDEQAQVQEALLPWITNGTVQLEMPDDGRFSTLKELLINFQPHVLFLSGHGSFHLIPHTNETYGEFIFESEAGVKEVIKDDELASVLSGKGLQAVILSACESGKAASDALSNGLMRQISRRDILHVIGMRESISDEAGISFARKLCDSLADQECIDVALQSARRGISEMDKHGQWCLPILISSNPHRPLIDWDFEPKKIDSEPRFKRQLGDVNLPKHFVGRRAEMRRIKSKLLKGEIRKLLITGPGGQGKTTLAGKLAMDMQKQGWRVFALSAKSNKLWRDFELEMEQALAEKLIDQYRQFLSLAENEHVRAKYMFKLLLEQFNGQVLLFLDGLESIQNPVTQNLNNDELISIWVDAAQQLQDLCMLVTSRYRIPGWDGRRLMLARANYSDFLQMAQRFHLPSILLEKREELRRAYEILGGNSRGLKFFVTAVQNIPNPDEERTFWNILDRTKADLQRDMKIEETFKSLPRDAQKLFQRLPAYHEPVPLDGLVKLGRGLSKPRTYVERLLAVSLLEASSANHEDLNQYQLNPLILDWMDKHNLIDNDPVWLNIVADYHVSLFNSERRTLSQAIATHHALRRAKRHLDADQLTLNYIVGPLTLAGSYTELLNEWLPPICNSKDLWACSKALRHTGVVLKNTGQYEQALLIYEQAFDIMRRIGDKLGEGAILNNIGQIYQVWGDYKTALSYFQQALDIQLQIGDRVGENSILNNMATVYQAQGDHEKASSYLKRIDGKHAEGATLSNLAHTYFAQGNYDTALEYLKQALANQQQSADQAGAGKTLNNISQIYRAWGNYPTALMYLKQALAIQQQIGDHPDKDITLNNISEIYVRQNDYEDALESLKHLLENQRQRGDKPREALVLSNIAGIYRRQNDYKATLETLEQALAIQRQVGDKTGEGTTLNNIASVYQALGEYKTAVSNYEQVLGIRQKFGDKAGEALSLNNLATIYQAQNDHNLALEYFKKGLSICQQIGNKAGESTILNNIALIYQVQGDYGATLDYLKKSLIKTRELGDQIGEGTTLDNIGLAYHAQNDQDNALEYLNQALVIRQQVGDKAGEGQSLNNLSQVHLSLGDPATAMTHLEQARIIQEEIGDKAGLCATLLNMGNIHLRNEQVQEAKDVWGGAYVLARHMNLTHALNVLGELAPKVGLSNGLAGWEILTKKYDEQDL